MKFHGKENLFGTYNVLNARILLKNQKSFGIGRFKYKE